MDYSKLSDFEINKAVAEIAINGDWFLEPTDESPSWFVNHGVEGKNTVKLPNYCNNPADAWPIIVESKINIEWHEWKNSEWKPYALNNASTKSCYDTNPLRSAMIVFLMMQESANVQDNPSR